MLRFIARLSVVVVKVVGVYNRDSINDVSV